MRKKEKNPAELEQELFDRYPQLLPCQPSIEKAYACLRTSFQNGKKLLVAGNGGSAADSDHIVGELMKSFLFSRQNSSSFSDKLTALFGDSAKPLREHLEGALPAISLVSMPALTSAFANDVDPALSFAQMVYGYGVAGDVFWGISTSGHSKNILFALMAAKAKGMPTLALTGGTGGECAALADIVICVPESETFKVQELHLPIYHALCAMLEADFFQQK